ncbi:MFS transporter [Solimonas sp. K1W22B-7]|uniref:spinster family MFS transporter n=1 Tax=Solimonas sp. K1W22B-7 TaxID=2303331 RepID=UPI000E33602B|nr:MFS transporter [Solimonas sp. K1W22B-7]AXQ30383.1 MFS transporter [Solimonas sp. K1W22B-7]
MNDPRGAGTAPASMAYAWTVVAILMIAYVFSFIDRQILNLLVGPIRRDLGISDTQMSLLMGFSFAIFYSFLGIPLGRLADSRSRRGLVAAGIVFWSLMTALCGSARSYAQLFLFRIGVGVGEAALSPAAYSMIADYFPPSRRATAISVYSAGIYLGSGIAFLLGGLVIQYVSAQGEVILPLVGSTRPWQVVFYILGIAGLLFSFAFLLVREPPRTHAGATVPFSEVVAYLWRHRRAVLCHNFGFAMIAFCSYGAASWIPSFYIRTFGWAPGRVGIVYGLIVMVFGTAGIVFGGRLTDRWMRQGVGDAALRVGLWACAICVASSVYLLMPRAELAMVAMVPAIFALGMPFGAAPAAIQEIVPPRMRGQASAVYLFIVNLVGLGVGPTAVALVTDYVFHDDMALRWSLLIVGAVACAAAALLLRAGLRPYREALQSLRASRPARATP